MKRSIITAVILTTIALATITATVVLQVPPKEEAEPVIVTGGAGREIKETMPESETEAIVQTETVAETVETETPETTAKAMTEEATETAIPVEPVEVCTGLPPEHEAVLREVCEESGVPYALALGLIYTESRFTPNAVSKSGCYGYCQLNPRYFPSGLSPEDNIRHGIGWLGELIGEYGDVAAALTAYSVGHDDGSRWYAELVMSAAEQFGG